MLYAVYTRHQAISFSGLTFGLPVQLAEGQDVYQLLASPYQDLWLHWLDQGNDADKQQAKDSNQQRLDFVRSVVAAAAMNVGAASQNRSAEHEAAAANGAKAAPQVWFVRQVHQGWCMR